MATPDGSSSAGDPFGEASEIPLQPELVPSGPVSRLIDLAKGVIDPLSGGRQVDSTAAIPRGTLIAVFGGLPLTRAMVEAQLADERITPTGFARIALQVEEDLYLVSLTDSQADWINHSCDPNAGLVSDVVLVALRDIEAGEEITFDYATSDGSRYDEFTCGCGSPSCRGYVTGEDWMREDLWVRYGEHFSPYLRRRIAGRKGASFS